MSPSIGIFLLHVLIGVVAVVLIYVAAFMLVNLYARLMAARQEDTRRPQDIRAIRSLVPRGWEIAAHPSLDGPKYETEAVDLDNNRYRDTVVRLRRPGSVDVSGVLVAMQKAPNVFESFLVREIIPVADYPMLTVIVNDFSDGHLQGGIGGHLVDYTDPKVKTVEIYFNGDKGSLNYAFRYGKGDGKTDLYLVGAEWRGAVAQTLYAPLLGKLKRYKEIPAMEEDFSIDLPGAKAVEVEYLALRDINFEAHARKRFPEAFK